MDALHRLAEERLEEAIRRGEFERLPGHGKPLELEDLSLVPEDLRAGYLLLKGAGHLPEEMELRKEFLRLSDLLAACAADAPERRDLAERRARLLLRVEHLREHRLRG